MYSLALGVFYMVRPHEECESYNFPILLNYDFKVQGAF